MFLIPNPQKRIFALKHSLYMRYPALVSLTTLVCILLFASCGSDNKSKETPAPFKGISLYARYDAELRSLKAEAMLVGDSSDVTIKEGIRFNEGELRPEDVGHLRYAFEQEGIDYPGKFSFSIPLTTPLVFSHALTPPTGIEIEGGFVNTAKGFTLKWQGKPLADNESFEILIEDSERNIKEISLLGPSQGNSVSFRQEQLSELKAGAGRMSIVLQKAELLKGNGFQGEFNSQYYTPSFSVVIQN